MMTNIITEEKTIITTTTTIRTSNLTIQITMQILITMIMMVIIKILEIRKIIKIIKVRSITIKITKKEIMVEESLFINLTLYLKLSSICCNFQINI